jgi:hypothetical protein
LAQSRVASLTGSSPAASLMGISPSARCLVASLTNESRLRLDSRLAFYQTLIRSVVGIWRIFSTPSMVVDRT